jgi:hypothetical protein
MCTINLILLPFSSLGLPLSQKSLLPNNYVDYCRRTHQLWLSVLVVFTRVSCSNGQQCCLHLGLGFQGSDTTAPSIGVYLYNH